MQFSYENRVLRIYFVSVCVRLPQTHTHTNTQIHKFVCIYEYVSRHRLIFMASLFTSLFRLRFSYDFFFPPDFRIFSGQDIL